MIRLQKYMAQAGVASRRKCEEYIGAGRVSVNGVTASIGTCVDEHNDIICLDGAAIANKAAPVVIMLNKPRGVVCTCFDPEGRRTTADFFVDLPYRVYNVGRLDLDSEGLLLFTNDGEFANLMTHPRYEVQKTYRVLAQGIVSEQSISALRNGVMLSDGMTRPAVVENVTYPDTGNTSLYITIHEGRNRQVRRMLEALEHRIVRLRRVAVGNLRLVGLHTGEWRFLTNDEIEELIDVKEHRIPQDTPCT